MKPAEFLGTEPRSDLGSCLNSLLLAARGWRPEGCAEPTERPRSRWMLRGLARGQRLHLLRARSSASTGGSGSQQDLCKAWQPFFGSFWLPGLACSCDFLLFFCLPAERQDLYRAWNTTLLLGAGLESGWVSTGMKIPIAESRVCQMALMSLLHFLWGEKCVPSVPQYHCCQT